MLSYLLCHFCATSVPEEPDNPKRVSGDLDFFAVHVFYFFHQPACLHWTTSQYWECAFVSRWDIVWRHLLWASSREDAPLDEFTDALCFVGVAIDTCVYRCWLYSEVEEPLFVWVCDVVACELVVHQ